MEIQESHLDSLLVLRPKGRLDNLTSAEFQVKLLQLTSATTADVIIDLADVEYISSGGLRALAMAARQKPADHRVGVARVHHLVQEIFAIAHFEQVMPVFGSLEEARRAWGGPERTGEP
ncbi:MAG: STAS domain-containing protein [Thiohalocapsa sp.]